jgi:hypothetical protein
MRMPPLGDPADPAAAAVPSPIIATSSISMPASAWRRKRGVKVVHAGVKKL